MQIASDKKLRNSVARNNIHEYLIGTKEHPSAEMIYNALKDVVPSLSLPTVYRNLKQLEELGLVIRVANTDGKERYDANCSDHLHFVCEKCGRVIDVMNPDLTLAIQACGLPSTVKIYSMQGLCELCAK